MLKRLICLLRGHVWSEWYPSSKTSPTGSDIIIDINYDGNTIFTNQANRLKTAVSFGSGLTSSIDVKNYAEGKHLTLDIDQVGSTPASWEYRRCCRCSRFENRGKEGK